MGKLVLNTSNLSEKQKRFISCRKNTINNINKDCKILGFTKQQLQELERDFL